MRSLLVAAAALALFASQAQAVVCTGGTTTVADGGAVLASTLLGTNACVEAGDKIFGQFSVTGAITGGGSASFAFSMTPGDVTIAFLGSVTSNSTGGLDYSVAVDPALSQGNLIENLQKDFTFNQAIPADSPATTTLSGVVSPSGTTFACTRTIPSSPTDSCPVTHTFDPVAQISVTESIATGANTVVTALTDTISQVAVPEPSALAMLGGSLIMLGFAAHRRRQH